jgi:hypothetical protein
VSPTVVSSAQTRPAPVSYRGLDYEITDFLGGHGYTGDLADAAVPQAGRYDMPESRRLKTVRSGAAFTVQVDAAPASGPHVLAETVRGARAVVARLPAGTAVPDPVDDRAAYDLVLAGEVHSGGSILSAESCVFRRAGEDAFTGRAGPDGATLLHLAFPGVLR